MQDTRSILELLKLLLSNIDMLERGLCHLILKLYVRNYITTKELRILRQYLIKITPIEFEYDGFWWPKGEKEPRRKWLKKQIEINLK
jgi:hypothetical protein